MADDASNLFQVLVPGKEQKEPKEKEQRERDKPLKKPSKRCGLCSSKLPEDYRKSLCSDCLTKILKEERSSLMDEIRSAIKEEVSSSIAAHLPEPPRKKPRYVQSSSSDQDSDFPSCSLDDRPEESLEGGHSKDQGHTKYLFASEDLDSLLKALRSTLEIEDVSEPTSVQSDLFGGLKYRKKSFFPVIDTLKDLVLSEWKEPEKRISIPKEFRNRLQFEDNTLWEEIPKVDIQVAKVVKKTDLPFEDSAQLKDPLDRKSDALLKRAWETSSLNIKTNIASTSVARTLYFWLSELESHLVNKTSRDSIIESLPLLKSATAFLADASAEALRFSAKEAALTNSVRRSLWLKQWGGDTKSKSMLCGIPFQGEFLFGSELDSILENAADRKKGFPINRIPPKKPSFPFPFRSSREEKPPFRGKGKTGRWSYTKGGAGRGFFSNPDHKQRKQ
ncbi:lamina-associated polypeptide 2, isoforms alpha/zeta-like [Engystomops pustulosus]|uniref:lamina-associated polypeptide 2, isoforms alpha/zeta-like n=1 Tax=Engystomops pustulosus TaxID=76066 RepID=UPI003AFA89A9